MIGLYIGIGILVLLIILGIVVTIIFHNGLFSKRWEPDGIVKYYSVEDFEGLNRKKVEFKRKKATLRGFIYSYNYSEYKGILVFSHGMWGSHAAYIQEIERLAKAKYLVLGFDYYGTELSDGKNTRSMVESLVSLDSAIKYVKKEYSQYDIYVMGHSWGGFASSNIQYYHPEIKKIVTMAPFISVKRLLCSILPKYLWLFVPFFLIYEFFKSGKFIFASSLKSLKNCNTKVLVLQSTDDYLVKYEHHAKKLQEKIKNDNVKFYIVESKGHNPDYTVDAVSYAVQCKNDMKNYSGEELINYRKNLDYKRMGSLDDNVFEDIINFLK